MITIAEFFENYWESNRYEVVESDDPDYEQHPNSIRVVTDAGETIFFEGDDDQHPEIFELFMNHCYDQLEDLEADEDYDKFVNADLTCLTMTYDCVNRMGTFMIHVTDHDVLYICAQLGAETTVTVNSAPE